MTLTTPQEIAYKKLKEEIETISHSSSKWGIGLIGSNGYGKSTVIRQLIQDISAEDIIFVYLNLNIPFICPEGKCVNWSEFMKQLKELSPKNIDFSSIEKIESFSKRIEKISSIYREAEKRVFIVLDHLEECEDWREARWPLDENMADVIAISNNGEWEKKEQDRVVTSLFQKKINLNKPLDYSKDEKTFIEIIHSKFELGDEKIVELFKYVKERASEGEVLTWWDIFREADMMEK
jgi:hypothetical protein